MNRGLEIFRAVKSAFLKIFRPNGSCHDLKKRIQLKIKLSQLALLFVVAGSTLQAQHVRVRLNFPVEISMGAPSHRLSSGVIWIGPEWRWSSGRYVSVPGYWARPGR
ncbi:MAG: hypothetical protein SGI83_10780 [Bacteroidota bacterium]|nr:hypothetical protein [Bacteroidota bacterium]